MAASFIGAVSTPQTYQGFVGRRARIANDFDATKTQCMVLSAHPASERWTRIKVAVQNFQMGLPDIGTGAAQSEKITIQYNGSILGPFTWGGSTTGTIADVTAGFSDWLDVDVTAGDVPIFRRYFTNSAGILYNHQHASTTYGEDFRWAASGLADQTGTTGAISGGTQMAGYTAPPLAIIAETKNASVLIIGDSITYGENDGGEPDFELGGGKVGLIARSMGNVPFLNIATPGQQAFDWLSNPNTRGQLHPLGSQAIIELGGNDFNNSRTPASVVSNLQLISAALGARYKSLCTICPGTTSPSNSFVLSPGDQVKRWGTSNATLNDTIRAGIVGFNNFYEVADQLEGSRNFGYWKAANPQITDDGLHPNSVGYALVASSGAIVPLSYP